MLPRRRPCAGVLHADGLLVLVVPGDLEPQAGAILDVARVALQVSVELVTAGAAERVDDPLSPYP